MIKTLIDINSDVFTSTDKKIAKYILSNKEKIKHINSHELAKTIKVGQSSIVRFTKKIGYQGFKHMQYEMKNSIENLDSEITEIDSTDSTIKKIAEQYFEVVQITKKINSDESIDKAVTWINKSKKLIVYGKGNSNLFAEYLSNHLLKMGCDSFSSSNNHTIMSMVQNVVGKNSVDLLILISESGETKEIIELANLAKNKNIPIISLTRMGNTSLSKISDLKLNTCNDLSGSRLKAMTNRCSQLYLIDVLSLNLIKKDFDFYMNNILESEKLLD